MSLRLVRLCTSGAGLGAGLLAAAALLLVLLAPDAAAVSGIYVTNHGGASVSAGDSRTGRFQSNPISVGDRPSDIAMAPDGSRAYVVNEGPGTVAVIDVATNTVIGGPIAVGQNPTAIALTPEGRRAYVANWSSEDVSVIDLTTNTVVDSIDGIGAFPSAIVMAPDGGHVYVTGELPGTVSVIDTGANVVVAGPIPVGLEPSAAAITPDGGRLYVANAGSGNISVIDTSANAEVPLVSPITIAPGFAPVGIAITSDGRRAYIAHRSPGAGNPGRAYVLDLETHQLASPDPIQLGPSPSDVAITPDGSRVYVANQGSDALSVISTATYQAEGTIGVGRRPRAIAIGPNRGPIAAYSPPPLRARPGVPVAFDATASKDLDGGTISAYAWAFGDGATAGLGAPQVSHIYAAPGTYQAVLTVTDDEGCSNQPVLSGRTVVCAGTAPATATKTVEVAYPGVQVRCPKRAKPKGCKFTLHVVAAKPKPGKRPKVQSAAAKAKAKAGRSVIVSLRAKPPFLAKLAQATSVVVRLTTQAGTSHATTAFRKLKVVR